jgi:hypothetical protein
MVFLSIIIEGIQKKISREKIFAHITNDPSVMRLPIFRKLDELQFMFGLKNVKKNHSILSEKTDVQE